MKIAAALALSLAAFPALAQKPCEALKSEIAAKIQAKGVKNARLEIVAAEAATDGKAVGHCELGKKKILYKKG